MNNKIFIKDGKQIIGIRKSCQLAARTLEHIKSYINPGISTNELDSIMESFIRKNGAIPAPLGYRIQDKPPFPKSTCISLNEVICHGVPNSTVLKNGDIVTIDITTILNGYFGDTAKTFTVGEVSEDAKHLIKVTEKCLDIGIKQVKPGKNTGEIGYAISTYALLQGCTVVEEYTGHGVGIFFHEAPQIFHICDKNDGVKMVKNMIFTIEPMICLNGPDTITDESDHWTVRTRDGGLCAQFEHTILVRPNGYEILTLCD